MKQFAKSEVFAPKETKRDQCSGSIITMQSLNGKPFVLPTAHSTLRHDLNHYIKLQKLHITPIAETQDTSLQKLLAKNGIGLAPFSEVVTKDFVQAGGLQKIGRLNGVYEEIWLVSAQRKLENPIAAKLMKTFTLH